MADVTIHKGLDNVIIDESRLSLVNGAEGKLIYSGYKIEDLAANALYEEVVYLLWNGRLPNKAELESLRAEIAENAFVAPEILEILKHLPKNSDPMAVMRSAVSLLSHYDPDSEDTSAEANRRKAVRLNGQAVTLAAAWPRIRKGLAPVAPRLDLNLAQNFIYMLRDEEPEESAVNAINAYMVLLTEHGMNASTFSARVTVSTGSDMHSAIVSAIGTLKGPAHGGANAEAMKMFLEIGDPANVQTWFDENIKSGKRRIMGIGHRVYKALDPRAAVLRDRAEALAVGSGNAKWFEIADKLAALARADNHFIERNLHPNVDYFSAIVLYTLDLDVDMFTPLFAMSRMAGWTAHIMEQAANNRLVRPDVLYTGPMDLAWVPVEQR
ncbi:MAG: 2-methylcitrate synthase/citrate synthase II [Chloroflexi bacterium OLB15]|nr:MAG: 2-methylcitrate synthase/citrate synthase II [Chloroflexi bacterium OLB15]